MAKKKNLKSTPVRATGKPIDDTYTEIYRGGVTINRLAVLKEELTFTNGGTESSYLPDGYAFSINRPDIGKEFRIEGKWEGGTIEQLPVRLFFAQRGTGSYQGVRYDGQLIEATFNSINYGGISQYMTDNSYESSVIAKIPGALPPFSEIEALIPAGWHRRTGQAIAGYVSNVSYNASSLVPADTIDAECILLVILEADA